MHLDWTCSTLKVSSPFFSLLEEEKALFLIKVSSYACCILLWLGGDDANSQQLCYPWYFAPVFLWLCICGLGFICSCFLLGGCFTVVILQGSLLPPTIYLTSLMMSLVAMPIMRFILPFQSPLLFQVSAMVSLDWGCQTLCQFCLACHAFPLSVLRLESSALHTTALQAK